MGTNFVERAHGGLGEKPARIRIVLIEPAVVDFSIHHPNTDCDGLTMSKCHRPIRDVPIDPRLDDLEYVVQIVHGQKDVGAMPKKT